jgi:hypothetical protein
MSGDCRVKDLKSDPSNRRKHPERNVGMLVDSLHEVGAARSIVIDENGMVLAGNGVIQAAQQAGIERVQVVDADGETIIAVRRTGLTDEQKRKLALYDNRTAELAEWDAGQIAADLEAGLSFDGLFSTDEINGLLEKAADELLDDAQKHTMPSGAAGGGYKFGEINPQKLGHRIEAAWRAENGTAIDLYSGEGQLAHWYARRFERVVRVDNHPYEGIDHVCKAGDFLRGDAFSEIANEFTFVDFDDEGSPLREVATLFEVLPVERVEPFVLCVTDGSGLNLKMRGRFDPHLYGLDGSVRQSTSEDYAAFDELVTGAVTRAAERAGWVVEVISTARGSEKNVAYQTFSIRRPG